MKTYSLKHILNASLFVIGVATGIILIFWNIKTINNDGWVLFTFGINGVIILFQLFKISKNVFSLREILFLFMLLFMVLSPLVQYLRNDFPWWDTHLLTEEKIIHANLIIMVFTIVYIATYKVGHNKSFIHSRVKNRKIRNIKSVLNVFFAATIICSVFIIANVGFLNLFARYTGGIVVETRSVALIIERTFRSVSVIYVG